MRRFGWIAALGLLAACSADRLVDATQYPGGPITVAAGQEFALTLGTLGPGQYASPPEISSLVVKFVSDSFVGPVTPAGPRQEYRFKAVTWGLATITFRHTGDNPTVQAVVQVR